MKKLLIVLVGIAMVGFTVSGSVISHSKPADDFALAFREKITNYVKDNVWPIVRTKRLELDLGGDEQKIDELRQALKAHREEMLVLRKALRDSWKNGQDDYPRQDPEQREKMQEMRFEQKKIMHEVFSIVLRHEDEIEEHLNYFKEYMDRWRQDIHNIASEWKEENVKTTGTDKPERGFKRRGYRSPGRGFDNHFPDDQGLGWSSFGRGFGRFMQPSAYVLLNPENMEEFFEMRQWNEGRLFPNPTTGPINIRFEVSEKAQIQISLFDKLGNKIETLVDKYYNPGTYTIQYDSRDLAPGVYFYEVMIGEDVVRNKFVKK